VIPEGEETEHGIGAIYSPKNRGHLYLQRNTTENIAELMVLQESQTEIQHTEAI
jgi:hypothetical protein